MLLVIRTLFKFVNLLNSETSPSQIASGLCFGMVMGLSPIFSLHNLIFLLVVFLFRVNLTTFFLSLGLFKMLGLVLDPFFDWFGYQWLVNLGVLRPVWVTFSTGPLLPYFRFNNTIVIGSLVTGLLLSLPLFLQSTYLIKLYRRTWRESVVNSRLMKVVKASTLYQWYEKYRTVREKVSLPG